ncbi:lipopolysaccharide biosynthesis protein [Variovorax sp. W2I14]|uniref:lipopolysaccharide biosynthesis protein n=1 Tax=Variovorax sp. W2I14 TaxID=3042290 RepID=UPI003D1FC918
MFVPQALRVLRAKLQSLNRAGFVRSVGVLVGGTAFAQAITVLVLPLLTRLYTPFDFSLLAVFASILSIISVVACLRLEIAIPMPESDDEAADLLALAFFSCTIAAATTGITVGLFSKEITELIGQPSLQPHLWLLPLAVWLAAGYSATQFWSTRKKRFGIIAKSRITQSVGGACTQVAFGWIGVAPMGLLLGQTINSGAGLLNLLISAIRKDGNSLRRISLRGMRRTLRKYDRFPKYSTFEAFANNAGLQLPIILIAAAAIGPEAGYLMLATRAMAVPMGLIGGAIAQVYLSRAPEELRNGKLGLFSAEILANLLKTGIGPLLFIGIVAPPCFAIVFGEKWERSGEIVTWMIPWFILQFMSSPISMVMHVVNKQRMMLALTLFGLIVRLGSVILASHYATKYLSEIYALSGGVFYLVCCWVFSQAAGVSGAAIKNMFRANFPQLVCWVSIAFVLRIFFYMI